MQGVGGGGGGRLQDFVKGGAPAMDKTKGLWETVCSHRPPFSTCFWGLKGGGGRGGVRLGYWAHHCSNPNFVCMCTNNLF